MTPEEFKSFFSSDKLVVKELMKKYVSNAEWTENSVANITHDADDDMDYSSQVVS